MGERRIACPEWQPAIAAWLMVQLGPEEEAALDAHMERCSACRTEANSLLSVAAVALGAAAAGGTPLADDEVPPVDLAQRVVQRIRHERRRRHVGWVVAGAAAVAVAVAVVAWVPAEDTEPLSGEPVVFTTAPDGVSARAVLAAHDGGSVVELTVSGLDPAVTYALWLTPPGGSYPQRVPAGTFNPDGDGDVHVRLLSALSPGETGRVWATTADGTVVLDTR